MTDNESKIDIGRIGPDRRTLLKGIGIAGISSTVVGTATASDNCDHMVDKDDSGNFNTIQAAVDAAASGDTVCVTPDTYTEHVVVDKKLTLQQHDSQHRGNSPRPVVDAPDGEPYAIEIVADDVTARGFVVQGATAGDAEGLTVQDTRRVHLENLLVRNNDDRGLTVGHSTDAKLEDITAENNGNDGITVWQSHRCTVSNCRARDNGDNGIYTNGKGNTVEDSVASGNGDQGIDVSNDNDVVGGIDQHWGGATVSNCESFDNDNGGIELHDDEGFATVEDCHTYDNHIASDNDASGLVLNNTSSVEVATGNDFEDGIAVNGIDTDP